MPASFLSVRSSTSPRIPRFAPLHIAVAILLACAGLIGLGPVALAENDAITHSFLGVGKANEVVIIGEDNSQLWHYPVPASDGWVLENGNVLLAVYPTADEPGGAVIEVDRNTNHVVFRYQGQQSEISTAIKQSDGSYVIAELGPQPRALVVTAEGVVRRTTPLACQRDNAHMQTRMLRLLPNGNYLAPHLLDFAVKEYNPATGDVLRVFPTDDRGRDKRDWPFTAIRLENGHTLIGCTNGNRVIEVDASGTIQWSVSNDDLGEPLLDDACGVQRLPNGNTVITSYHATGDRVKLCEVTRDKKVVWRYSGMNAGFHHFQILTTNGEPVRPNTWK
jgi:hypothetical protein